MTEAVYSRNIPFAPGYYVYRLLGENGACLYVGAAGARGKPVPVTERLRRHAREQAWASDVTAVEVASFATSAEAAGEERHQIRLLCPVHNKMMRVCEAGLHDVTVPGAQNAWGACRECTAARMRKWRTENPGKWREYRENAHKRALSRAGQLPLWDAAGA